MLKETSSSGMPSSAILAIIGGALMVTGGALTPTMLGIWKLAGMPSWMTGGSMMGCTGCGMMMFGSSFRWNMAGIMAGIMAAISIGAGVVSIVGGYTIYKKAESLSKWSVAILVSSIVGLVSMSGFFIGPVLGIIGGILALTKN